MAKIVMPDGQSFQLDDEIAQEDNSLRAALKVAYPDAANATFTREGGKDGKQLVVKVAKKAGTKGLEMSVEEFNQLFEPGTPVKYHPVIGQPFALPTKTRSEAWEMDSGQLVVQVEGKSGCVSLAAITIDPDYVTYARLGSIAEGHPLDCLCADCKAFLEIGDKVKAARRKGAA
jgi:hypothetical protein